MIEQVIHLQEQTFDGQLIFEPTRLLTINFDYGYLNRTLTNLVKNAIEALDDQENKYIGIFSEVRENNLVITFENNGPKIPEEVQKNMFDKFYTTKEKKSGSGLGLSIVRNVLTDHNASITVYSDDDITRFTVSFELK
jgi:signal transduction histidine kinase